MFHRLQWKIVSIFVLLVTAIMFIVGVFMLSSVVKSHQRDFTIQMEHVMSGDFSTAIADAARNPESRSHIEDILSAYTGQIGLGAERSCYILNAQNGAVIASSRVGVTTLEKTPNIVLAMGKGIGDKFSYRANYMDYAYYLNSDNGYIIYIRDSKRTVNAQTMNMISIILQALLFAVLASVFLGYFLSKTITTPITILTEKAEDFADGRFDSNLEVPSEDEIGILVETFNYMGGVMNRALKDVAGEKHKIEIILEHVNNGIIAFNSNQEVIHVNRAAKQMLNVENTDEVKFDELFKQLDANVCMAEFLYLEKFKTESREIITDNRHIQAYFVPFKINSDSRAVGVVVVLEDVTEQFKVEESRRKFVAEVSHELKTPLTTIGTYTETLLDGYIDDKQTAKSFLNTILNETNKMTVLVKNLLTLSKFDAQKIVMDKEVFNLGDLAKEVTSTFEVEAESKHIKLSFHKTSDSTKICADHFQIERAIKNVISNSIKYTNSGGAVKVFVGQIYNEAYVKVEDTGVGIPPQDLPHVFDRFYRVDKARSRENGGTGLGLSISKEIVDNHGGNITIESVFGEYTRVTVNIPIIKE